MPAMRSFALALVPLAASVIGQEVAPPKLTYLYSLDLEIPPPIDIGKAPFGNRGILGITGGKFSGPRLNGGVLQSSFGW